MEEKNNIYSYIISAVRKVTPEQRVVIEKRVDFNKSNNEIVFDPKNDAPQDDETGFNIVMKELEFFKLMSTKNNRVDIFLSKSSEGSVVDLGMGIALNLRLNFINEFNESDVNGSQVAQKLISELIAVPRMPLNSRLQNKLRQLHQDKKAIIDWNVEMKNEEDAWQRIDLGLALGFLAMNPDFKIRMGKLIGEDDPNKKSYPKVIKEIERRQNIGEALFTSR